MRQRQPSEVRSAAELVLSLLDGRRPVIGNFLKKEVDLVTKIMKAVTVLDRRQRRQHEELSREVEQLRARVTDLEALISDLDPRET